LVIAVVVLEIALRVIAPRTGIRRLLYQPAATTFYQSLKSIEELLDRSILGFVPHTESYGYVLNAKGLRTTEYIVEKPRDVFRVLAFGDSFTWASGGLPHEQHWPTVLEKKLRGSLGGSVEVLRLGVPATGPDFQFRLWQIEGSRLDPDLVILGFFVGNDFVDHRGRKATKGLREHPMLDLLGDYSFGFRLARNLVRVTRGVAAGHGHGRENDGNTGHDLGGYPIADYSRTFRLDRPTFRREKFMEIEARRMALCLEENNASFEFLLDKVGATLMAFHQEVEDMGGRFVVMVIPDEYQVDPALAQEAAAVQGRVLEEYDLKRPSRRLGEYLNDRSVDVLDLTPEFIRVGGDLRLYRRRDTHWNRSGNRLAADLLDRYLTEDGAGGLEWERPDSISGADFETGDLGGFRGMPGPGGAAGDLTQR